MSSPVLCAIKDLTVEYSDEYGTARILDNVSLSIPAGEIFGLVGQSGSGKSTLGLAMLGLLADNTRVVSGCLELDGRTFDMSNPKAMIPLRRGVISMIFQDPLSALNPVFTIGAHLKEVLGTVSVSMHPSLRQPRMCEALDAVGFTDPVHTLRQYPHELSGGMRQRVVIAMAILAEAKLVVADEPTTALDPEVEQQVMAQLVRLKETIGCSIVLISHSFGLVSRLCDTVNVMLAGQIIERGPAGTLLESPSHAYTRDLLACEVNMRTIRSVNTQSYRFPVIRKTQQLENE